MDRDKLIAAGINYDEGLNRFAGIPKMYEKYLHMIFTTDYMGTLKSQLDAKDYPGAFRTAHDLKGMSGNLSMNEFYESICQLVEELRDGTPTEVVEQLYNNAKTLYEQAQAAVEG